MFTFHPRMAAYDFGPRHPLKPERLLRTVALLRYLSPDLEMLDPGLGDPADLCRVHSHEYVAAVRSLSEGVVGHEDDFGFVSGDNPPFRGMYEAALAYAAGSAEAARRVVDGAALSFNIAGGLHHAKRSQASGFCVFNDCAVACHILRERFERVAYVDIDLHHGDGVQEIFYDDPSVLTCSIHESGRFLYPGTGFVEEKGAGLSAVNVPLAPMTTGDTWLWAFEKVIVPRLREFDPGAIVLQMGADPHFLDPLGHLRLTAQEWLGAVVAVKNLEKPIVALGGGGYEMSTVPRMWCAAVLTLLGRQVPESIDPEARLELGWADSPSQPLSANGSGCPGVWTGGSIVPGCKMFDSEWPEPRWSGREEAEQVVEFWSAEMNQAPR